MVSGSVFASEKPKKGDPWDVAVIGSGPAGLTSAIYTTRGAASTIIFAGSNWGGQLMLTTMVDNFPGFPKGIQGPELMDRMRKQVERFGAQFLEENVSAVDFEKKPFEIAASGKVYTTKSVIISTGSDTKWLGVKGEDKLRGKGVSSCAPCDAPFFKDKLVAVVGGGDSAMEEALVLTKYSPKVYIIHRRGEFRASKVMQDRVFKAKSEGKIEIIWNSQVEEIKGEESAESVILNTKRGFKKTPDLKGREILSEKGDSIKWTLPVQGVFVAIGHIPATDIFSGKIETDKKGYIVVKKERQTQIKEGVFVAGDVHDYKYRQAITAAGFGCMAAMDALNFLDKGNPSW